ncbi:MAG: T9SS type A sorting domain-containing protein [Ignavibacteria bacterium]|nr:T9SS type A sorting domain-containing protein [Ignavibacteria bacterium]
MKKQLPYSLSIVLCFLWVYSGYSQAPKPLQLGVNLDDNGAFVNMVNHTNRYNKASGYDKNGWPTSDFDLTLLDGRPATEWTNSIDDPEKYRIDYSGRYAGSFVGSATFRATGTSVSIENLMYDSLKNTTQFELVVGGYPNANHALVFLGFTNTRRTAQDTLRSGITELKVLRPGYAITTNKVFTDEYIALCKAADFAAYRYYNVQNIWDGEPTYPARTTWDKRKTPQDASQRTLAGINGKRDGWCWEYIIELANILNKDIWVCLHMSCDSGYVTSLAQMLKEKLNPGINIYVENSNEVWSPTQLTHGPYNQAEATFNKITFDENYARRSVELSKWFALVYGQQEINNKIRVILAGQHAYNGRSDNHLNYIKKVFGAPKDFIYATSTALYFGSTKESNPDPRVVNQGMAEDITAQISNAQSGFYRLNHISKAKNWELKGGVTSYEGGPHMPSGGGTVNLASQILSHRTEEMGAITKLNYSEGWQALGGGLAMYFTLTSAYNRYGCWGITDDYTKPDRNFKMKALRELTAPPIGVSEEVPQEQNVTIGYDSKNQTVHIQTLTSTPTIAIYSVLGEVVMRSASSVASVRTLPRGLYTVVVQTDNGQQFVKSILHGGE